MRYVRCRGQECYRDLMATYCNHQLNTQLTIKTANSKAVSQTLIFCVKLAHLAKI